MAVLTYLVGLPGSGKSWVAETLKKQREEDGRQVVILSSDSLREELYGNEEDQQHNDNIFEEMQKRTIENLQNNIDVIYDATNINRKKRITFLNSLPKSTTKVCWIVWSRLDTCVKRDSNRSRKVGYDVIKRMALNFQVPWYDEGWTDITVYRNDSMYNDSDFNLDIPHDSVWHKGTIKDHIERVEQAIWEDYENLSLEEETLMRQVAHLHDIGKPIAKTFVNSKGETTKEAHYYGHENVSSYIALEWEPYYGSDRLLISYIISQHMQPHLQQQTRYFKNMEDKKIKSLIEKFSKYDDIGK